MKKAYLYNNYVIIEDGINVYLFNIYNSFTVVNSNDYTIQSSVGNRAVILIADAPNWYDETGTIPFDADSLLLFLETYTGQFQKAENGIPEGGTTGQILAKIDGTDYNAEWIDNFANWTSQLKHEVKAGQPLIKGQAVYVSSADGTNMIVSKASNVSESTSSKTMGLIAQNLATNGKGYLITEGLLAGLNTSTANAGDPVWLGTNGNLIFGLTNKPSAPAHLVFIGIVTRSNSNNGEIFVKVQNGFELQELHNVAITSPANKNTIFFNSSNSLWENRLIAIDDVSSLQSALNSKENTSNKGIANGYASLGGDGKVPSSQLPSYVDDVIEVANYASLPSVGETGVIYITLDNNKVYRWTGSTYVQISQPNAIWGSITGTLSNQTDLQSALNAKQDAATAINTSNIGSQSVAYATNAGNSDTLDGYHASAFQMVLTNPITGTGTTNYVSKFTASGTIGNSLIFDNGSSVGIGTTTPFRQLDVNGDLRLQTGTIDFGNSVNNQIWVASNNINFKTNGSEKAIITSGGYFGVGTSIPSSILHLSGTSTLLTITDNTYGRTSNIGYLDQANLYFANDSNSNTYIGRYNNLFLAYGGGNVGIGTENPLQKLHVNGNILLPVTNSLYFVPTLTTYGIGTPNSSGVQIFTGAGDYIRFGHMSGVDNFTERMRVDGNGNVGIGTTIPQAKLDVLNKVLIGEDLTFGGYYGIGWGSLQNGYNRIFAQSLGGSGDGLFLASASGKGIYFRPNGGSTDALTIAANNYIGINTTAPSYPIHLNNPGSETGILTTFGSANIYLSHGGWGMGANKFGIGNGSFPSIVVNGSNENVGIGTTNPIWKFVVSKGGAAGLEIDPDNGSPGYVGVYSYNRASGSYYPLLFQAANYYLTIGSVGIGTTTINPSAILQLESTTQGFLPPRMDNSEMTSIANPAEGLIVYSTQSKCLFLFDGASWQKIAFA